MRGSVRPYLPAVPLFAVTALIATWPLGAHLSTHMAGPGFGDNATFFWNFWWMREALASTERFFFTPKLLAPFGVDLTLHTHTALPAFVGATVLGGLAVATALNVTIICAVFLSGLFAFALARQNSCSRAASVIAGLVFCLSPFAAGRLNGHFNLIHTWVLPLFVLAISEALARRSLTRVAIAGLVAGATAYVDYYYVVFDVVLAACLFLARECSVSLRRGHAGKLSRASAKFFVALAVVDLVLIVAIQLTGGFQFSVAGLRVSARSLFNPLQAFWLFLAVALWFHFVPKLVVHRGQRVERWHDAKAAFLFLSTAAIVLLPLLVRAAALVARGQYVSQEYFWRSAPKGVDLGTVVMGHPFQRLWGDAVRGLHNGLGIDSMESSAWLGVVPLVLAVWAIRHIWHLQVVRMWLSIAVVFFVWSLGPHLHVWGFNTGLVLPEAFLRWIPVVSNARIPGRAMVVAFLALSVIAGVAVTELRTRVARPAIVTLGIALLVVLEFAPSVVLARIETPALYSVVASRPEQGSVCELPLGLRDGFGMHGFLDDRVLIHQATHKRPLVGGFVARIPEGLLRAYTSDPLFSSMLRLSGSEAEQLHPTVDRESARQLLHLHGIRFIVLDRENAAPQLITFVHDTLPVSLITREGTRELFVVNE